MGNKVRIEFWVDDERMDPLVASRHAGFVPRVGDNIRLCYSSTLYKAVNVCWDYMHNIVQVGMEED